MSLINDALRRASQTEKNRPNQAPAPMGMEAVPETRRSGLTIFLAAAVVVVLLLACLFFWQWWKLRNSTRTAAREASIVAPVTLQAAPPPVATPKPAPVVVAAKIAPAPVIVAAPTVVATPIPPKSAPIAVAAPVEAPVAATPAPAVWPTDLKVSAIFFSRTNPRVMMNGNIYGVGDEIEGAILKKVLTDRVILQLKGHARETKELFLEGQ